MVGHGDSTIQFPGIFFKMGLAKMMTNHQMLARTHRMTSNAGKRIGIKCLRVFG